MAGKIELSADELPWRRRKTGANASTPLAAIQVARNKEIPGKVRLFQLLEHVLRKSNRTLSRADLVYTCRTVTPPPGVRNFAKVKVSVSVPALESEGPSVEDLSDPRRKKQFYERRADSRRCFLEAQQTVAAHAVEELLEIIPPKLLDPELEALETQVEEV